MLAKSPVINDHGLHVLGFDFLERSEDGHDVYISVVQETVWTIEHLQGWGSEYQISTNGKSRYFGVLLDFSQLQNLLVLLGRFY